MKRLVLGSLLSCMIVGQVFCYPDVVDFVIGGILRMCNATKPVPATSATVDVAVQAASLGGAVWLGTGIAQRLAGSDTICRTTMLRNGRLALGAAAFGSLCKGIVMKNIDTPRQRDMYLSSYEDIEQNDNVSRPSVDQINSVGAGKMLGAYAVLAGLAITRKKPGMISRAWTEASNWFSKPSSRIQE